MPRKAALPRTSLCGNALSPSARCPVGPPEGPAACPPITMTGFAKIELDIR